MKREALWAVTAMCVLTGAAIYFSGGWGSFATWSQKTVAKRDKDTWKPYQPERVVLHEVWVTNWVTRHVEQMAESERSNAAAAFDDPLPGEKRFYATNVDGTVFYAWAYQTNNGVVCFGESRTMTLRQMLQKIEESKRRLLEMSHVNANTINSNMLVDLSRATNDPWVGHYRSGQNLFCSNTFYSSPFVPGGHGSEVSR